MTKAQALHAAAQPWCNGYYDPADDGITGESAKDAWSVIVNDDPPYVEYDHSALPAH